MLELFIILLRIHNADVSITKIKLANWTIIYHENVLTLII